MAALRWCGLWRNRHHVVDRWMLELLRGTGNRWRIGRHHRESVGGVVAGVVLPRYQVVPIHALRALVVIVFTSVCFASLRRRTPIASASSPGSVTISTSRHGGETDSQPSHFHLEISESDKCTHANQCKCKSTATGCDGWRNESEKMQIYASSCQRPSAAMMRGMNPTNARQCTFKSAAINRYDKNNKFKKWQANAIQVSSRQQLR